MGKDVKRLFAEFVPEHYGLEIKPDREAEMFTGTVTITGKKVYRPNQRLTFHQKELKITKAEIIKHDKKGDEVIPVDRINHHAKYGEVRLHSNVKLYPGAYTVVMEFRGKITQVMSGIYPCFFEHAGKKKQLLATQFESHHAREVFPCIDEPEAKATFDLTLVASKGETVISNTPIKTQKAVGKFTTATFETTPRMSTYLLAFVIGEMHFVERKTKDGIAVRSWSSVAQPKEYLTYSAEEGVRLLEFFTDYFGIPYPLAKCDQVALPDFDAGAMENWGLITYREIALLADPKNRSISSEQYISLVVAHELSHQWFGNLVTMKWWDDLWLNESFASLMEHIALDAIHPEWQQWETYTATDVISTSTRDVYSDIQPVGVKVSDPDLIHTLFDPGIVYAKGGRLLKMLREYIGDEAFTKGLKQYFKKHEYANATREDLWQALGKASGQDISGLMTPWIAHPGMPMLHITQTGKEIQLKQERFLLDNGKDDYVWPLPLLTDIPLEPAMIKTHKADVTAPDDTYAVFNHRASGHFVSHYTEAEHRQYLAEALQKRTMRTEARINLFNDLHMLVRHGDAPLTEALDLVVRSSEEPRENVWSLLTRHIASAGQLTEGDKTSEDRLKLLKRSLAKHWYDKLGWKDAPGDDANTKQLRQVVISLMIGGEDQAAIDQALGMYKQAKSLQAIPAELRATILVAAVKFGDKRKVIEHLLREYDQSSPDVQLDITTALSSNRDPDLAKRILDKALGPKGFVRAQDVLRWVALFLRNYYVRAEAWALMEKHWKWLETTLQNSKSFDFLPVYCAAVISTPDWEKKFHKMFDPKKDDKTLKRNIAVGSADITARIAWRQRDEAKIARWLSQI
jgi:aminopeptidase N